MSTAQAPSHIERSGTWIVRASVGGLLAVLCFLTFFSLATQHHVADPRAPSQKPVATVIRTITTIRGLVSAR